MSIVDSMWRDHLSILASVAFEQLDADDSGLCYCDDDECWLDHM